MEQNSNQHPGLFTPLTLRSVTTHNRIVVSPMWQYTAQNGYAGDWHLVHLGRFAVGGAGIVFTEGVSIAEAHRGTLGDLGIWNDDFIPGLSRIAKFLSENGSVPGIQLIHAGRKTRTNVPWDGRGALSRSPDIANWDSWQAVGATETPHGDVYNIPKKLTVDDIADSVRQWGEAARRAHEAGFKILEIHGAHGYLIHEFLSPLANTRTDEYGGSFENRSRYLKEIIAAIRQNWPADLPLFLRLSVDDFVLPHLLGDSPERWTVTDTVRLVKEVTSLGVDVIDCSSGGFGNTAGSPMDPTGQTLFEGYQLPLAEQVKKETGARTMTVGLIRTPQFANEIVEKGQADLIALGREMLMNPNWPAQASFELEAEVGFSFMPKTHDYYLTKRKAHLK